MDYKSFPEMAADLIREKGVNGLCASDGCPCCSFQVMNVSVEVACHKSGGGPHIWVSSASMDYDKADLEMIAKIVQADIAECWGRTPYEYTLNDDTYEGRSAARG